jgi:Asp-tRNA(Asn)/Glu-tRNA(Gln) amidotransferase A subunit family amidase
MPVTAKLSRAFYERLGDEIANELVSWFNAVDLTYRTELRELNDLNFARFDAKVGERLAELRAEMDARFARAEVVLAQRLAELRGEMEARFARADVVLAQRLADLRVEISDRLRGIEDRIGRAHASTIRWMFVFWAGTGAMVTGWVIAR